MVIKNVSRIVEPSIAAKLHKHSSSLGMGQLSSVIKFIVVRIRRHLLVKSLFSVRRLEAFPYSDVYRPPVQSKLFKKVRDKCYQTSIRSVRES